MVIVPARERSMLHLTCPPERTLLVQVSGNLLEANMILCFDWQPTLKDLFCSRHRLDALQLNLCCSFGWHFVYSTCKAHPNLVLQWWFPFTQNKVFWDAYCKTRALQILKGCCFCPTELLSTGCGSSSYSYHAQQLLVLAGVWWCLCLWVPGWKRLPEFLLLLWRLQRWRVAKGPCACRHFGTRCILSCLLSHLFPIV